VKALNHVVNLILLLNSTGLDQIFEDA